MTYQLIYSSRFSRIGGGPSNAIRNILERSETNNFRDDITGFLIFDKSVFIQILEGDQAAVLETYGRIGEDPRHTDLTVIDRRQIDVRAFSGWSMGGHLASHETRGIFARYGVDGDIDPAGLDAPRVLALAQDLLAFEMRRKAQRVLGAA